jgi:hypothetical protein
VIVPVKPGGDNSRGSIIVPIERVILLVKLLKVVVQLERVKQSGVPAVNMVDSGVVGTVRSILGEVEITCEDGVGFVRVIDKRGNFRSPDVLVGAVEIAVDNVNLFACSAASECGLNGRTFMNNLRGA